MPPNPNTFDYFRNGVPFAFAANAGTTGGSYYLNQAAFSGMVTFSITASAAITLGPATVAGSGRIVSIPAPGNFSYFRNATPFAYAARAATTNGAYFRGGAAFEGMITYSVDAAGSITLAVDTVAGVGDNPSAGTAAITLSADTFAGVGGFASLVFPDPYGGTSQREETPTVVPDPYKSTATH